MKKPIRLLWLLLWLCTAVSNLTAQSPPPPQLEECNLLAPATLAVTAVTASSLSLTTSPVAGAVGYEWTASVGGIVVQTQTTAGTTVTFTALTAGTNYTITVAAICPDGTVSCHKTSIDACTIEIIIDVVIYFKGLQQGDDLNSLNSTFRSASYTLNDSCQQKTAYIFEIMKYGTETPIDTVTMAFPSLKCCPKGVGFKGGSSGNGSLPSSNNRILTLDNGTLILKYNGTELVTFEDITIRKRQVFFKYRNHKDYYIRVFRNLN